MTTYTDHTTTTDPNRARAVGAATTVVAVVLTALFAHDWTEIAIVAAVVLAVALLVFGRLVPRGLAGASAPRTALTLGILAALLVVPAFWSGLPAVLGVGAMILGNHGRSGPSGAGKAIAGLVLGALATAFYVSVYVMEGFAGQTGFLLG